MNKKCKCPNPTRSSNGKHYCIDCYNKYQSQYQKQSIRPRINTILSDFKLKVGCVKCGYRHNVFALQFDHIIPRVDSIVRKWYGPKTLSQAFKLISDPNIQVLCANCHCIKTRENNDHLRRD